MPVSLTPFGTLIYLFVAHFPIFGCGIWHCRAGLSIKLVQGMMATLHISLGIDDTTIAILVVGVSMHENKKQCSVGRVPSGWRAYLGAINENRQNMAKRTPCAQNDFIIVKNDCYITPIWYVM